jgi:hypothetical protein
MKKLIVLILLSFFIFSCASDLRVTPLHNNRYEISVTGGDLKPDSSYDKWLAEKAAQLCPGYILVSTDKKWSPFDSGLVSQTRSWVIECPATANKTDLPH